ncbi:MAG: CopG family transcriptional regulator [Oscillospiraceae bacterium]
MRKRNVQILFRLTEEEAEHLNELVRKSGRSKEAFLREMVRGINVNIKMYIFDHLRMYIFAIPPLDRYIFSIDKIFQ